MDNSLFPGSLSPTLPEFPEDPRFFPLSRPSDGSADGRPGGRESVLGGENLRARWWPVRSTVAENFRPGR